MTINDLTALQATIQPLTALSPNKGQMKGLPKNPRFIKDDKFESLCKNIEAHPLMAALREIIAIPHKGQLVIVAGNMRYRAMMELHIKEAPVKIIPADTPADQVRAIALLDNASSGQWDFDILANEFDIAELAGLDIDIPFLMEDETEEDEQEEAIKGNKPAATITFDNAAQMEQFKMVFAPKVEAAYGGAKLSYKP